MVSHWCVDRWTCRVVQGRRVRTLRHSHGGGAGDQAPQRHDPGRRSRAGNRQVRQQSDVTGVWPGRSRNQEQRSQHSGARRVSILHRRRRGRCSRISADARSTAQPCHRENQVNPSMYYYKIATVRTRSD